jgi:hypothetical protein
VPSATPAHFRGFASPQPGYARRVLHPAARPPPLKLASIHQPPSQLRGEMVGQPHLQIVNVCAARQLTTPGPCCGSGCELSPCSKSLACGDLPALNPTATATPAAERLTHQTDAPRRDLRPPPDGARLASCRSPYIRASGVALPTEARKSDPRRAYRAGRSLAPIFPPSAPGLPPGVRPLWPRN